MSDFTVRNAKVGQICAHFVIFRPCSTIAREEIYKRLSGGNPAWEDLIVTENLTVRLEELDGHLNDL